MDKLSKSKQAAIERLRKKEFSLDKLWLKIIQKDKIALGEAITYIESSAPAHQAIADELLNRAIKKRRDECLKIGVTGTPGVGKSTFINVYAQLLDEKGFSVAVLAIDPSSRQSGGSILGDKTRMIDIQSRENIFVRPSPSGKQLGGVSYKTREVILLCEAAGFDRILVETVGVGQSETAVHQMTDVFLLLMLPGAGDELQGIKRGIMEMADILIVHKADGVRESLARASARDYAHALHLFPSNNSFWNPKVLTASSEPPVGTEKIHTTIEEYFSKALENGFLFQKRNEQSLLWFQESLEIQLLTFIQSDKQLNLLYKSQMEKVKNNTIPPFLAARKIIESLHRNG
ncbi:MAG: methylmalonyl Co-A mutase-associated GTPase MeaB [Chitinophagales bacterium]|nr:methylmalonyl Co-A mutase-associated GTPase MeaB [Chitinophagales bacterium]